VPPTALPKNVMVALHPSRWTLWTNTFRRLYSSILCARRKQNGRTLSLLDMWYVQADQLKAWVLCIYGEGAERPLRRRLGLNGESGEERTRRNSSCNQAPVLITSLITPRESGKIKVMPARSLARGWVGRRRRAHTRVAIFYAFSTSQINQSPINQISWVNLQLNSRTILNHLLCIIRTIEFYLIY
jgi:hypothetical protein